MVFFRYLLLLLLPFIPILKATTVGTLNPDITPGIVQSEESKKNQDESSCASIESVINATLAEEEIYKQACLRKTTWYFYVKSNGNDVIIDGLTANENMFDELKTTLKALKNPASEGMNSYKITIEIKISDNITQIGKIDVELSDHDFKTDIRTSYK